MHNFGGGRSDSFNSGGRWSKGGGGGYFQNSGGSWLKRGVKKFRGVWILDEAMPKRLATAVNTSGGKETEK